VEEERSLILPKRQPVRYDSKKYRSTLNTKTLPVPIEAPSLRGQRVIIRTSSIPNEANYIDILPQRSIFSIIDKKILPGNIFRGNPVKGWKFLPFIIQIEELPTQKNLSLRYSEIAKYVLPENWALQEYFGLATLA